MEERERFIGLNSIKFTLRFYQDEACYQYLADIKWENGYICKKCGSKEFYQGVKPLLSGANMGHNSNKKNPNH